MDWCKGLQESKENHHKTKKGMSFRFSDHFWDRGLVPKSLQKLQQISYDQFRVCVEVTLNQSYTEVDMLGIVIPKSFTVWWSKHMLLSLNGKVISP
jgi:hypothetical protein